MGRRKLTAQEKQAMQRARAETHRARELAREALTSNPQFTNPKFWKTVDPDLLFAVEAAISKAMDAATKRKIADLKAQIEMLESR